MNTMRDRVCLALDLAPGTVPPRYEAAYRRGGTPTNLHLATLAAAAGTTPMWLMTGYPEDRAIPTTGRNTMADQQPDEQPLAPYRERRAAILADTSTATARLRADLIAGFERFERDRRAEIIAAGGDPDEDRAPFEHVRVIADQWADTANDPTRRAALLDQLADRLNTSEVRALRLAAEAVAAITPRLIQADADAGVRAAVTADDLGVTESYVYRVLRDLKRTAATVGEYRLSTRHNDQQ